MSKITTFKVTTGVHWVEVAEANMFVLCGCPADTVKHLKKKGFIEEVNKNGTTWESGPNAILLSEVLMQNGYFSNLTEFPVLQMLYLQGMILPNHPNNTGIKPMLIGSQEQVEAQMEYIFRGNYGLISKEEMIAAGVSETQAEEMMQIKLKFAFGRITPSHQLLDSRIVSREKVELRNGVFIRRLDFNVYEFEYKGDTVQVNLNLNADECYEPSYQLGYHYINRDYFAVVHSGEGDGWDINRPCMASVLMFQGKIYLIDAGPNILASLNYLGISVNEIEGIFHTHAHDDHFAGLTTLIRSDHRFKYYATRLVRTAVAKKLCALMSIREEHFTTFFDIHDLPFDKWSNVEGLEIMPVYSPHPVETNIFFFRAKWDGEYKTYGHFADIVSSSVFSKMISQNGEQKGVSQERYDKVMTDYLRPVNLKKIDIGGGLIHGNTEDFRYDKSDKIVLAHTSKELTVKQREVGSSAAFGMVDVLIPANHDYLIEFAYNHLAFYFPDAPEHELNYLLNHPIAYFNAGTILCKRGLPSDHVYLLLTGSVEYNDSQSGTRHVFSAGSLIGFYSGYLGYTPAETFWAASNISVLQLPIASYNEFVARNNLHGELKRLEENILFLRGTWLFGEIVSFPILTKVAKLMKQIHYNRGQQLAIKEAWPVCMVMQGEAELRSGGKKIEKLVAGDFFGGNTALFENEEQLELYMTDDSEICTIPADVAAGIPVVYWKMLETHEKRMKRV